MTILKLITAPNSLLKQISQDVTKIDDEFRNFLDDMIETMYYENGVGLAAVQVGVLKRALVMDLDYEIEHHHHHHHDHDHNCQNNIRNSNPQYFINPEIIEKDSEQKSFNEGCLSFPEARAEVTRPKSVTIKFLDYFGKERIEHFEGVASTCIQHEVDHLNGITFVDHISKVKRDIILNKMRKYKK